MKVKIYTNVLAPKLELHFRQ